MDWRRAGLVAPRRPTRCSSRGPRARSGGVGLVCGGIGRHARSANRQCRGGRPKIRDRYEWSLDHVPSDGQASDTVQRLKNRSDGRPLECSALLISLVESAPAAGLNQVVGGGSPRLAHAPPRPSPSIVRRRLTESPGPPGADQGASADAPIRIASRSCRHPPRYGFRLHSKLSCECDALLLPVDLGRRCKLRPVVRCWSSVATVRRPLTGCSTLIPATGLFVTAVETGRC